MNVGILSDIMDSSIMKDTLHYFTMFLALRNEICMDKTNANEHLIQLLNSEIIPFKMNDPESYRPILDRIGEARIVLLGEATHGTQEFYQSRIELTKLLIKEKGFHAIAIEGDWTSAYSVHRYIQSFETLQGMENNKPANVQAALEDFKRFPAWMWRNQTIVPFIEWLKQYNCQQKPNGTKIGFYGLDLYCLYYSMQAVIDYLRKNDPVAAEKAIQNYSCFEYATAVDPQMYGLLIETHLQKACVREVTEQLLEMQNYAFNRMQRENSDRDALFYATQNARLVKNAEHYYRAMFEARDLSWNIRDEHMAETLQNIITHLETQYGLPAKVVIWAHNSHVGDARAAEMSEKDEINLGQILRERYSSSTFHLGFTTYSGSVTAADNWDEQEKTKEIVPALPGSYEALFHELKEKDFILDLHQNDRLKELLQISRLHRAIGVIYAPETERESHYFFSRLPLQFDAIIHIDETTAVKAV